MNATNGRSFFITSTERLTIHLLNRVLLSKRKQKCGQSLFVIRILSFLHIAHGVLTACFFLNNTGFCLVQHACTYLWLLRQNAHRRRARCSGDTLPSPKNRENVMNPVTKQQRARNRSNSTGSVQSLFYFSPTSKHKNWCPVERVGLKTQRQALRISSCNASGTIQVVTV